MGVLSRVLRHTPNKHFSVKGEEIVQKVKKVLRTIEHVEREDVICNLCGASCECEPKPHQNFCFTTLSFDEALCVYGSDLDEVRIDGEVHLCEQCTVKFLASLRICPPLSWSGWPAVATKEGTVELTPESEEELRLLNEEWDKRFPKKEGEDN